MGKGEAEPRSISIFSFYILTALLLGKQFPAKYIVLAVEEGRWKMGHAENAI